MLHCTDQLRRSANLDRNFIPSGKSEFISRPQQLSNRDVHPECGERRGELVEKNYDFLVLNLSGLKDLTGLSFNWQLPIVDNHRDLSGFHNLTGLLDTVAFFSYAVQLTGSTEK